MSLLTRETIRSFRRAPMLSALSITTIAFSLFTVGLFGLVAVNMREALRGISTRVQIEAWRREYNEERPEKALGGLTPAAYARQLATKAVTVNPGF